MMLDQLQVFVITGAAGGIGAALCEALLAREKVVYALDYDVDREQIRKQLQGVKWLAVDVTDKVSLAEAFDQVIEEQGAIDCLINNAGIMSSGPFRLTDLPRFERIMAVNFQGVVNGCHLALKLMATNRHACIVNIASAAGITPVLNSAAYAASKHAVVGFTRSLSLELNDSAVHTLLVVPGLIDTSIFDRAEDEQGVNSRVMADNAPIKKYPASRAADDILQAIDKRKTECCFPRVNRMLLLAYRLWPKQVGSLIANNQRKAQQQ